MGIVTEKDLAAVVDSCAGRASFVADQVILLNERARKAKALMLANLPKMKAMGNSFGFAGWATFLSVDLRDSSRRAMKHGLRDTYITMHTYIPTMAYLVDRAGGTVVGLRGDGLFAAFGLVEGTHRPNRAHRQASVCKAIRCGLAMIEAVDDYIDPKLNEYDCAGLLKIGVGIAKGKVVVTRIGWEDAQEVTAYGGPVNLACKMRGDHCVEVSDTVWRCFPGLEEGGITAHPVDVGQRLEPSEDFESLIDP